MKKTVYLIEFNNGDVSIQRSITTLKNAIYKWCIYNDEYYLTDHQLNSIILGGRRSATRTAPLIAAPR